MVYVEIQTKKRLSLLGFLLSKQGIRQGSRGQHTHTHTLPRSIEIKGIGRGRW